MLRSGQPGSTLDALRIAYSPGLFAGVRVRTIRLPEYPEPYRVLEAAPGSPLRALLAEHPLVRVAVPPDLRARDAVFRQFDSTITRSVHSQPPHIDFPHRPGDPRRYNVFWTERARANASTYFISLARSAEIARGLSAFLRANREAWAVSEPFVRLYRAHPLRLSRYLVPAAAIEGFVRLVRRGEDELWSRLTDFGKTTTVARILSNNLVATRLLVGLLADLRAEAPGSLYVEGWAEPCVVLADDTRLYHGRLGEGESGGSFYRMWLCGDPVRELRYLR